MAMGWVESSLYNHHEVLKTLAQHLRGTQEVQMIEWSQHCKIYFLHKDMVKQPWKQAMGFSSHLVYQYEPNMYWICIFKRYKVLEVERLVSSSTYRLHSSWPPTLSSFSALIELRTKLNKKYI